MPAAPMAAKRGVAARRVAASHHGAASAVRRRLDSQRCSGPYSMGATSGLARIAATSSTAIDR
ncbi:MAG: hypothetical protein MUF32_05935 [Burkholderiaceae bacterium]|nr:hypothetical protein [Burkholderiaceae bacterium]